MGYTDYEHDVLRTLSLQFNVDNDGTGEGPTSSQLAQALRHAIRVGEEVDVLKRAIFYGSTLNGPVADPLPALKMHVSENLGDSFPTADMIHSAMGIFTEAAEFLSAVYASCFDGQPFDATNAIEELGDLEWYMAVMRKRLDVSQEQVQRINIAKLKARYPARFASNNALNRDLSQERAVLESSSGK